MIFKVPEILFFSINNYLTNSFNRYLTNNITPKLLFKLNRTKIFNINELQIFLSELELERLSNFILIVDAYSLDQDKLKIIKELIIIYPEVKFQFLVFSRNDLQKLFFSEITIPEDPSFNFDLHSFSIIKEKDSTNIIDNFKLLLKGKNNLFDASYLRSSLKYHKLKSIGFHQNFDELLKSRKENLAFSIDEETSQTFLNSYALYKYGFRVLPITSFNEIIYYSNISNEYKAQLKLIVRDWDLQFEDLPEKDEPDFLNIMRGFYYNKKAEQDSKEKTWKRDPSVWDKFKDKPIFIISRLDKKNNNSKEPVLVDPMKVDWHYLDIEYNKMNQAKLQGIAKPLGGLIEVEKILKVIEKHNNPKTGKNYVRFNLPLDYENIKRTRDNKVGHSVPPDIYHIGQSLISRAQKYFEKKMYLTSAVLSQECLEILNGLHNDLYLDALYNKHLAEISLETEFFGLANLSDCAKKRVKEIRREVERIGIDTKATINFLSQVYNDIRHLYKEKEQIDASEVFLAEFVSINHGINIFNKMNNVFKKFFK